MSPEGFNSSLAVINGAWHRRCNSENTVTKKTRSNTVPELTSIAGDALAIVTGGLLPWESSPPMSSAATGFGAWERAMKAKGLL